MFTPFFYLLNYIDIFLANDVFFIKHPSKIYFYGNLHALILKYDEHFNICIRALDIL